jgi:hypothetical protein
MPKKEKAGHSVPSFRPTPIIPRYMDQARPKAAETKALGERMVTNQASSKALNIVEMAIDRGSATLPTCGHCRTIRGASTASPGPRISGDAAVYDSA